MFIFSLGKIVVREVVNKAIEARKAALVEASWCRILRASGIDSKEAEDVLAQAEKKTRRKLLNL
ncbi:hypothetical protein HanHA300_Chr10g0356461 [Helianthus annuus]|nr:hypothetical protein HanHA300_Chr10g0356461 [Helianthus annuus]KAJ0529451.1 hypothetical protein HanHA89_Chr10g0378071 [Helianthus annuus]KAJ0696334.1 hypothetical protein HanLR1_Chr10g0355941 [Helianthus annuus]